MDFRSTGQAEILRVTRDGPRKTRILWEGTVPFGAIPDRHPPATDCSGVVGRLSSPGNATGATSQFFRSTNVGGS